MQDGVWRAGSCDAPASMLPLNSPLLTLNFSSR
nr:MAG TPA: hypothetical protein [Caudoviricetes sp.]